MALIELFAWLLESASYHEPEANQDTEGHAAPGSDCGTHGRSKA